MVNAQIPGKDLILPYGPLRNTTHWADLIMPPIKFRVCRGLAILLLIDGRPAQRQMCRSMWKHSRNLFKKPAGAKDAFYIIKTALK